EKHSNKGKNRENNIKMKDMTVIKSITVLFFIALIISCKSNPHLQKDITKKNFHSILECNRLKENDNIRLSKRTVCVKEKGNSVKVGKVLNGKEKWKWYHYYVAGDTIDCYLINKIHKKDTVRIFAKFPNPRYW